MTQVSRKCLSRIARGMAKNSRFALYQTLYFSSQVASTSPPWLEDTAPIYKYFQNGTFQSSMGEAAHPVRNPATNEILGIVPEQSPQEVDGLIEFAQQAQHEWKEVPLVQRQRIMMEWREAIRKNRDELAYWIVLENGKTLEDAHGDIHRGLEVVESACWLAPQMLGSSLSGLSQTTHMECVSYREPLGVVAGICPFNFPAMIPLWMIPLAVTAGNAMVLKPSEKTPSAACFLAQLATESGLPEGVLQLVQGGKPLVDQICDHPSISAISFVGGNAAGSYIYQRGTSSGKRVQSNLGAKNHAVILPDASREATVSAIVGAAFGAAGQRCMAVSTLVLVGNDDECKVWIDELCEMASRLKVGPGLDQDSDVGPVITAESKERILKILAEAVEEGAALALDGREVQVLDHPDGHYIAPTIVTNVTPSNVAYTEELFGPVLVCLQVASLEEAISIVNENPYGNGCALFTQSGAAARHFTANISVGQVGINVPIPVPLPMFSFTGSKASFMGDLNFYGPSGVQFFTKPKTVTSQWPKPQGQTEFGGLSMPTSE